MPTEWTPVPLHRMTGAQFRSFQESRRALGTCAPVDRGQYDASPQWRSGDFMTWRGLAVSAAGVEPGAATLAWIGEDYRPEPEALRRARLCRGRVRHGQHAGVQEEGTVHYQQAPRPPRRSLLRGHDPDRSLPRWGQNRSARGAWLDTGRLTRLDEWPTTGRRWTVVRRVGLWSGGISPPLRDRMLRVSVAASL